MIETIKEYTSNPPSLRPKPKKHFFLKKELYSEKADYDENDEKYNFTHQIRNHCDQNPKNSFEKRALFRKRRLRRKCWKIQLYKSNPQWLRPKPPNNFFWTKSFIQKTQITTNMINNYNFIHQIRNDCDKNPKTQDRHHTIYLYFLCFSFSFAFSDLLLSPSPST